MGESPSGEENLLVSSMRGRRMLDLNNACRLGDGSEEDRFAEYSWPWRPAPECRNMPIYKGVGVSREWAVEPFACQKLSGETILVLLAMTRARCTSSATVDNVAKIGCGEQRCK